MSRRGHRNLHVSRPPRYPKEAAPRLADPCATHNTSLAVSEEGRIDREGSRVEVWVIPTDEELLIARDTVRVVLGIEHPG